MSTEEKKQWNEKLTSCANEQCREISLRFMDAHKKLHKSSVFSTPTTAQITVVSLHSFTLNPTHVNDNLDFLFKLFKKQNLNIVAPYWYS